MDDVLVLLNQFATACAAALQEAKVAPPADHVGAVMVLVGKKGGEGELHGVSLNYADGKWNVEPQVEVAERVH